MKATSFNEGPAYDLIIAGGGVSGSIAAIAAARLGVNVLLVEEHGFLGGSLTSMGVGPMMSFHNPAGEQIVRGIPDELIQRLVAQGASPGHIADTTTYCSTVTPFDSEALKMELEDMLYEAGGSILYHTQLAAVECTDNHIHRIIICNKAGLTALSAKSYIDATGDADLAARSGVAFIKGRKEDAATQPMTMNLKLANVDTAAVRKYATKHPENFLWHGGMELGIERLRSSPRLSLAGYLKEWKQAQTNGEVDVPRDQVLFFETAQQGTVIVNTSRIAGLDPTDPYQLSEAECRGRRQCAQIYNFLRKYAVGFENAIRMDTAAKIGVRESRHILGLHILTAEEIISSQDFADTIAMGGYPIDIHSPGDAETRTRHIAPNSAYQIPLRSLLTAEVDNLAVVGRCISATHEASAAFRVTPIAMAIGQAGGVVAATAIQRSTILTEVPYKSVQENLRKQGANLPV